MKKSVCMISDKHGMYDDRIYWKQAISLKKNGFDVTNVCLGKENLEFVDKNGIKNKQFWRKQIVPNLYLNFLIKKSLNQNVYKEILDYALKLDSDVYIIHDYKLLGIAHILKQKGRKVIYDIHDPFYLNLKVYNKNRGVRTVYFNHIANQLIKQEKKIIPELDGVIVTEENLAKRYEHLGAKRLEIIYNYTTLNAERLNPKITERKYDLIYCGLLTKFRGAEVIPDVLREVKKVIPDIQFLYLGNIETNTKKLFLSKIEDYDLDDNVTFMNPIPYNDVSKFYLKSKIGLALFHDIETHHIILPIKLFEYLAHGNCIIGSHFGHINNYIIQDNAGISVQPNDISKISNAIINLLQDKNKLQEMNKNNITQSQKYRWQLMEERLMSFINEIV